ncbi:MAG: hypothetical protein LBN38_03585 [Verrucomicrobiota bacterium]|nr:hypothetical protein [Verrucomicrobiota bacterium]
MLLHGEIGVGKSTVLRCLLDRLEWERPQGYRTHWNGLGRGASEIWFETWDGRRRFPMAARQAGGTGIRRYTLNVPAFLLGLAAAFEADADRPTAVDELGWLECAHPDVMATMASRLQQAGNGIWVLQNRALSRWEAWMPRTGMVVEEVTLRNREHIVDRILERWNQEQARR